MSNADVATLGTEAMGLLIEAVEQIPSEAWDRPSNLEGWSIRDLVGHVTGSAAKIVTLVEGGEIWQAPSQPDDWKGEDPAARLRELAARLQDALPGADMDAGGVGAGRHAAPARWVRAGATFTRRRHAECSTDGLSRALS